jgi:hypothetical protein
VAVSLHQRAAGSSRQASKNQKSCVQIHTAYSSAEFEHEPVRRTALPIKIDMGIRSRTRPFRCKFLATQACDPGYKINRMARLFFFLAALLVPAVSAWAQQQPSGRTSEQLPSSPQIQTAPPQAPRNQTRPAPSSNETLAMQFEWVREGPAEACGDKCREWIAAVGRITADTPREFDAFSRTRDLRGTTLVLDSPGGAVSGLGLGRSIRGLGIRTTVGKTGFLPPSEDGQKRATLSPKANCASMCAFVLLGGARRHVPAEARVLVHQIWPSAKRDDATAANYTAIDLVRVQRELGNLARYTMEMGADIQLFEIAMRIPPWEALRPLSNSDLVRFGIYNSDDAFELDPSRPPATLGTVAGALPVSASSAAAAAEPVARVPAEAAAIPVAAAPSEPSVSSTQQWTIIDRAGTREIVRRNPLTIEGDELGVFELRLSCGPGADTYSVVYAERRKLRPGEATAERLNGAILLLGRERAGLTITASARNGIASDLISVGRGRLPKSAVNDFVEGKIKSVAIATRTSGNARSLIRVGNTGLAQAFSQMTAGCGKPN